ncbi:FHA domain-containing protein [bacterium]|nr:FHA domain-containing protein [bacterium]
MKLSVFKDGVKLKDYEVGSSSRPITVGRDSSCEILLDHKRVSRSHAEISLEDGQYKLQKRSGYEGLFLNGNPVDKEDLNSGDQISIPPFLITVFHNEQVSSPEAFDAPVDDESLDGEDDFSDSTSTGLEEIDPLASEEGAELEVDSDEMFGEAEFEEAVLDEGEFEQEGDEFALDDSGDGTRVIQNFASYSLEIKGKYAPFDNFVLSEGEMKIGRDKANVDLFLKDPEVSSVHTKITRKNALITIEDMQSGNGTLLNGKRVNKGTLENGDEISIGSTNLTLKIASSLIDEEEDRLMPVEENQFVEIEEIVEVLETEDADADIEGFGISKEKSSLFKDPDKRKKLIYGFALIALGFVMFSEDEAPVDEKAAKAAIAKSKKAKEKAPKTKTARVFTDEEIQYLDPLYLSAKSKFENGQYTETLKDLEDIFRYADEYKNARQIEMLAKQGLAKIEELNRKKQEEIEKKKREKRVQELLKKAADAVEKKEVLLAENYFSRISKLDPENQELEALKGMLEIWKKQEEERKVALAAKKAERERKLTVFKNTKSFYNRGEWYNSVVKLQAFIAKKDMDDDLIKEAQKLLEDSKNKLKSLVDPLIGKARSLKEAQDLKGVYSTYGEVLKHDPSNTEALNEIAAIRDDLITRGKTIYREALIAESLSLFQEARDKFKEVLQISPEDSDYFKKAQQKLRDYLDYK